jgi:Predicted hydrolases of HD superfamily
MDRWIDGAWMQTYGGVAYDVFDPHPDQINIFDIATALANTCRFNGHVKKFYSVAQHCVLLAEQAPPEIALQALLHDAAEAYIGDLIQPIKKHPGMETFRRAEELAELAICAHFALPYPLLTPEIKELDRRILIDERNALLADPPQPWADEVEPLGIKIEPWTPDEAREQFLNAYREYAKWAGLFGYEPRGGRDGFQAA